MKTTVLFLLGSFLWPATIASVASGEDSAKPKAQAHDNDTDYI